MGSTGTPKNNGDPQRIIKWLIDEGGKQGKAKPIDIDQISDKSLQGIEARERSLAHEELYVFDKDGNLTEGYSGNANSVAFPTSLLDREGATVTHGHPKGMEEFGGTFSFADVNNMLRSKWAEHRATAGGQGEMNYIMRRTANSNVKGLQTAINRAKPMLTRNIRSSYETTFKKAIAAGKSTKQAKHEARQRAVGILNAYYKRTMPKYGFEYINRKEDYKYNR